VPPELTDEARERVPNDAKRLAACVTLRKQRIFRWRHMPNAAAMLRLRRFLLCVATFSLGSKVRAISFVRTLQGGFILSPADLVIKSLHRDLGPPSLWDMNKLQTRHLSVK
jgi:hypothetical protein